MTTQSSVKERPSLLDFSLEELQVELAKDSVESYRAAQIFEWIFDKGVFQFDRMRNLPKELRERLRSQFCITRSNVVEQLKSNEDKSVKFLLSFQDNDLVETVLIPRKNRQTVCLSTQVGCKFHCAFCASGQSGFFRNLSSGEILEQFLICQSQANTKDKNVTHVVFMGIGEPFDNFTHLLKVVRILNSPQGVHLGARKITISTCGVIPKIKELAGMGMQIELSVSLHAPNDVLRNQIMPVNRAYPLGQLLPACKEYVEKTNRIITFEYILIKNFNDSMEQARELVKVLKGIPCKINLIPLNPIKEFDAQKPDYENIVSFQTFLKKHKIQATVRFSRGGDIAAACGQLRGRVLHETAAFLH